MNKFLLSILTLLPFTNCFASDTARAAVYAAAKLGQVTVQHNKTGFSVTQNGKTQQVPRHLVDKQLRDRSNTQIAGYLAKNYLIVKPGSDGKFSIQAGTRAEGGAIGGATIGFLGGKFIFSAVCHGTIGLIAAGANFIVPGSGLAVGSGLESVLAAPIEAASLKVGLAAGIIVGAATGPL